MNLKIDTKEKFHEISVLEQQLTANMTEAAVKALSELLDLPVKNVIMSLDQVQAIDLSLAEALASVQASFYEQGASFVICGLQPSVQKTLDNAELLDIMNITPTLSEAWDIVQMEEVERELLNDF
jgi:anti-anti-sigma factor